MYSRFLVACLVALMALDVSAQANLNGIRARVLSYNTNVSTLKILTIEGEEFEVRWNDTTQMRNKLRKAGFDAVSEAGQDVTFLLGYKWREFVDAKRVDLRYGYIFDTRGEVDPQMPDADKSVITGLLLPSEEGATLKVGETTLKVRTNEWSRLLTISPTIIESALLGTDDIAIWAERVGNTLYAKTIDFYVGEWKERPKPPEKKPPKVIAHRPGYDPPGHVNHMPAIARGVGFSRVISRDFGPLPKAVNVIRRNYRYDRNGRRIYNTRDPYSNRSSRTRQPSRREGSFFDR
jgi:hypothetical protein